jgi:hypothetical protein
MRTDRSIHNKTIKRAKLINTNIHLQEEQYLQINNMGNTEAVLLYIIQNASNGYR